MEGSGFNCYEQALEQKFMVSSEKEGESRAAMKSKTPQVNKFDSGYFQQVCTWKVGMQIGHLLHWD